MRKPELDFAIFHPREKYSKYVQGIWSASVPRAEMGKVTRWLQSDGGSGILFNLGDCVYLNNKKFTAKIIILPVNSGAHSVTLPPGANLAGVRFYPAIGYSVIGSRFTEPTELSEINANIEVQELYAELAGQSMHRGRISAIYRWLGRTIDFTGVTPESVIYAVRALGTTQQLHEIVSKISLSQRQLERQFKKRIGMSPKALQRILRVKNSLTLIKENPEIELAALALESGYSDQAHLTREIKSIANVTPRQYRSYILNRKL